MTFPNLVIAGAPKSGTTSVYTYLDEHPDVCGSKPKETLYFIDSGYPLFNEEWNFTNRGLEGYRKFFTHCETENCNIIFEATPDYLYQKTPLNVLPGLDPVPDIIFILRNPSMRVFSMFQFAKNNVGILKKDLSFSDFINMLKFPSSSCLNGRVILQNSVEHGKYINYIKEWMNVLERKKIHVLLFENLVSNPKSFMKNLSSSFNINPDFYETYNFKKFNKTYKVKNQRLHMLWKKIHWKMPTSLLRSIVYKFYNTINTDSKGITITNTDREILVALQKEFRASNDELSTLLDIDVSHWEEPLG